MTKLIFKGKLELSSEDDGTVLTGRLDDETEVFDPERFAYIDVGFVDAGLTPKHEQANLFKDKQVLITVEVVG